MKANNRRQFLKRAAILPAAVSATASAQSSTGACAAAAADFSLCGKWRFTLDPQNQGLASGWQAPGAPASDWPEVDVPHTWQISPGSEDYFGVAWYRREFDVPASWRELLVRVAFEAVFHSAEVFVNGTAVGAHLRKGYTAFAIDITPALRFGERNVIAVRVNNAFDEEMLPRGRSSDWTHDGGIYRPVRLLATPRVYLERLVIDAVPDESFQRATLHIQAVVANGSSQPAELTLEAGVIDDATGLRALQAQPVRGQVSAAASQVIDFPPLAMESPKLWHFDHPHLYRLEVACRTGATAHTLASTFGVRRFEVRDGTFHLNGERVRLFGVERMAGSNPEFGMAEPAQWLTHDHDDMKELNCVFTRVHWQQDRRVLDYCDRNGILIQVEVPTWGPKTFEGMGSEPSSAIMNNGLEQLREMIGRDRNHPSVFAWGLCNEIGGQNPPAYAFAARMYEEAKKLDPRRLRTYASNSLQKTPGEDVSRLMDFVSWNEYFESWMDGGEESLKQTLDAIGEAFPGKPVVISEYGYCACTAGRPEGDARRIDILTRHTRLLRDTPFIAGLIFFCYNDYRTHIGDKGTGVAKQRVHGVVDLYGRRKPSFARLREKASPVSSLEIVGPPKKLEAVVAVSGAIPAYSLRGYKLRWIAYGNGDFPLLRGEAQLPLLLPAGKTSVPLPVQDITVQRLVVDVIRPTGFSARTVEWRP